MALGLVAYKSFYSIASEVTYLVTDPVPGTVAIIKINGAIKTNYGLVHQHINATNKAEISDKIMANKELLDKLIKDYDATISAPEDRKMFDQFKVDRAAFVSEFKAVLELSTAGKGTEASARAETQMAAA